MKLSESTGFWLKAFAIRESAFPHVAARSLIFGLFALAVYVISERDGLHLGISAAPYEVGGAALGLLLVLRTNAGYDRWWEARKLWGAIVNQSRNLAISAVGYGPDDPAWRDAFIRWTAAFPHVVRHSLRGERTMARVAALLGDEHAANIATADHMPGYVALRLADLLREARDRLGLDPFVFLQIDRERALLIDHLGGCERILKSPLPRVYGIEIRRFIVFFLIALPLAFIDKLDYHWVIPLATLLIAYPLLALDQIGAELQNPFDVRNIGHLPLDDICDTIERNVLALGETRAGTIAATDRPMAGAAQRSIG